MKSFFSKSVFLLLIFGFFFFTDIFAVDPSLNVKNATQTSQQTPTTEANKGKELDKEQKNQNQPVAATTEEAEKDSTKNLFTDATYENFEPPQDFEVFDKSYLGTSVINPTTSKTPIDSGAITLIQSTFLGNLNLAFSKVAGYALNLFYLFATLEVVVFGLIWALQRDIGFGRLFFKIIKIGLIFFIIKNYTWLLDVIIRSFAQLAGVVINNNAVATYIFNPAKIWQYGYNSGVHLLQLATVHNNFGLAMVQLSLGMGILLVFGLLGIQMILQLVGFYSISLGSLILLPFGTFTLGRGMFDKAVQAVFQAGIRLMALITIIGVAVVIWDGFKLTDLETTTNFNINQPLGLFFTALLFLCLAFYLPKILSQAVGSFSGDSLDGYLSSLSIAHEAPAAPVMVTSGASDMQAATTIETGATTSGVTGIGEVSVAAAQATPAYVAPMGGSIEARMARETLAQASALSKSISESTAKRVKEAVLKAMKKDG